MTYKESTGMLVCNAEWQGVPSFKMIALSNECPYNEIIFDPTNKVLAIISKEKKRTPQLMNSDELHIFDMYYEYFLEDKEDIMCVINRFAINPHHESLKILEQ